ncbi:hypothetical protein LP421_18530 [Rhizobium sp. RCAM05350]|nr:hypothetical protein LP421_18530 [Rhizobium sp. RCAM05350]
MVHLLGGPGDLIDRANVYLPKAPVILPVEAPREGYLQSCNARDVGMEVIALGEAAPGPTRRSTTVSGFSGLKPLGTKVEKGEPFAFVHAVSEDQALKARARLQDIYAIGEDALSERPVIVSKISG